MEHHLKTNTKNFKTKLSIECPIHAPTNTDKQKNTRTHQTKVKELPTEVAQVQTNELEQNLALNIFLCN